MLKKLNYIIIFVLYMSSLKAQQIADYTLARENAFVYNPAITGSEDANILYIVGRKEWTKIKGSPLSINLAYHMPLKNKNIGLGGYIINDITGPSSYTGINFSFAYHIDFTRNKVGAFNKKALSFGLSLSAVQYRLNGTALKLDQPDDDAIFLYRGSQFYPDAAFGIFYKSKKVEAGLSIPQLLHLDVPVKARQTSEKSTLRKMQHYYGFFIYKFDLSPKRLNYAKHYLEPSVNIHYVINAPFQAMLAMRYNYDDIFFFEFGYRSLSTMIFDAGVTIAKQFSISYAYDFNLNPVRQNLGSVHELHLQYAFNNFRFKRR